MNHLFIWFISYALPALIAGTTVHVLPRSKDKLNLRNIIIIHVALILSILVSQYFIYSGGLTFPWFTNLLFVWIYILVVVGSTFFLGQMGFWYGVSALLQQLTILSIAFLLLPVYPFHIIILLIVPLYSYCHLLNTNNQILRIALFLLGGSVSILIFSFLHDVFLLAALHTLGGTLLISKSIIHPEE